MNRRNFLRLLGLTAAAAVLDPERLLWVPGRTTYFVMPPAETVIRAGNTFITPEWITAETLRALEKHAVLRGRAGSFRSSHVHYISTFINNEQH